MWKSSAASSLDSTLCKSRRLPACCQGLDGLLQDLPDADTFKYPKKLAHMLIMDNAVMSDVLLAKDRWLSSF